MYEKSKGTFSLIQSQFSVQFTSCEIQLAVKERFAHVFLNAMEKL